MMMSLHLSPASGEPLNVDPSPTCAPINRTLSSSEADYAGWTSDTFSNIAAPPVNEGPPLNNESAAAEAHEHRQH